MGVRIIIHGGLDIIPLGVIWRAASVFYFSLLSFSQKCNCRAHYHPIHTPTTVALTIFFFSMVLLKGLKGNSNSSEAVKTHRIY